MIANRIPSPIRPPVVLPMRLPRNTPQMIPERPPPKIPMPVGTSLFFALNQTARMVNTGGAKSKIQNIGQVIFSTPNFIIPCLCADNSPPQAGQFPSPVFCGKSFLQCGQFIQCPVVAQQLPSASISQFTAHRTVVINAPANVKFTRIPRKPPVNQNPAATGPSATSGFVTGRLNNAR